MPVPEEPTSSGAKITTKAPLRSRRVQELEDRNKELEEQLARLRSSHETREPNIAELMTENAALLTEKRDLLKRIKDLEKINRADVEQSRMNEVKRDSLEIKLQHVLGEKKAFEVRVNVMERQINDLKEEKTRLSPLVAVGAGVRRRFLEQSKSALDELQDLTPVENLIKVGNNLAYGADIEADVALCKYVSPVGSDLEDMRRTLCAAYRIGVPPEEFPHSLDCKIHLTQVYVDGSNIQAGIITNGRLRSARNGRKLIYETRQTYDLFIAEYVDVCNLTEDMEAASEDRRLGRNPRLMTLLAKLKVHE